MKLASYIDPAGARAIGVVDVEDKSILDLQAAHRAALGKATPVFDDMLALIDAGDEGLALARDIVKRTAGGAHRVALETAKLLAPVPEPRQIRDCNNFEQHMRGARIGMEKLKARLAGKPEPDAKDVNTTIHPVNYKHIVFYISNRFNVSGPDAEIEWPPYTECLDFECEIGFFIGKRGRDIPKEKALEHVFGYTIFNDFSARDQQADEMEGRMGPTKGKSFDTSNVVGPWIVTRDEIPDYRAMSATVRINGEERGKGTTAEMIHPYEDIIAYISRSETLHPGELIGTGTLGGCCALETGHWPKDGDVVEIEVDKIGVLRNRVRRAPR
jgi:2-keto-4-pentenoate hydratase/2-oxohepta-3-ene-1,7-dioic acid hydratase in catechol pathway